jgi:hypothetical protein
MQKKKGINFHEANRIASESIRDWLPGYDDGKRQGEWVNGIPNPTRPDRNPDSFGVNPAEGRYHDFTGETHDLLHLYAIISGQSDADAARSLLPAEPEPYETDISALLDSLNKQRETTIPGEWDHVHHYTDGVCSFFVCRRDARGEKPKEIRPATISGGQVVFKKPPKPAQGYPLLNLDKILTAPADAEIVLVEGEVKSEAIPEPYIATSIAGGANAWKDTDLSPLIGKKVILWPDNDDPGKKCMEEIRAQLPDARIITPAPDWPKGADAANFSYDERVSILSSAKKVEKKSAFPLVKIGSRDLKARQWLIKGLISKHSFTSIFGASYTGKSYVAVDLACRVATGEPFCGYPVKTPGAVVYIAGEGYDGIEKRFLAWTIKNGKTLDQLPVYISLMPAALGNDEIMKTVSDSVKEVAALHDGKISLIIFDTWARNFEGNENDSADTNAAVRTIDNLKNTYECAALIVHHTGKGDQTKARGSSVLYGALDFEFSVTNKNSTIHMENTKMKDGTPPPILRFGFENIVVGEDEDGEDETSAVLNQIDIDGITGQGDTKEKTSKGIACAIDILKANPSGIFISTFLSELTIKTSERTAFRTKKSMIEEGKIIEVDGKIFLAIEKKAENDEKPEIF